MAEVFVKDIKKINKNFFGVKLGENINKTDLCLIDSCSMGHNIKRFFTYFLFPIDYIVDDLIVNTYKNRVYQIHVSFNNEKIEQISDYHPFDFVVEKFEQNYPDMEIHEEPKPYGTSLDSIKKLISGTFYFGSKEVNCHIMQLKNIFNPYANNNLVMPVTVSIFYTDLERKLFMKDCKK